MTFESLALCEPLLRSLKAAGYRAATPIQQQAIPVALAGRDVMGCAQTGTGKTAAFTLPTIQRLITSVSPRTEATRSRQRSGRGAIRALILTPTRELAAQVGDSLASYGKYTGIRHTVIFGGVPQGPQVRALQAGIDVLVATPGRLLDLIEQGFIQLSSVEVLILDEADRMLDMGFIPDLRKIVAHVPERRQTLMFSATMPQPVRDLATQWMQQPFQVKATRVVSTPELVVQSVCFVEPQDKTQTLIRFLNATHRSRTVIFSRTKHRADRVARYLQRSGIRAVSIHGNKSQTQRLAALREFNSHRPPVLVATDLAARGLDFSDVSHVINYDLPDAPETYVHRIGRTARAGAAGNAISFCSSEERPYLRRIEKLTGKVVAIEPLPGLSDKSASDAAASDTVCRDHGSFENGSARRGKPTRNVRGTGDADHRRTRPHGRPARRPSSSALNQRGRTAGGRRRRATSPTT